MESDLKFFFAMDLPKEVTEKDLLLFFEQSKNNLLLIYILIFQNLKIK